MTRLRVCSFSLSLDGFGAGPDQDLANPMGRGGMALHEWAFATRTFHRISGTDGGATGIDDDYAREPLVMTGGTTFHFVTGGIHAALQAARKAAAGKDIRLGGGVATIRDYLRAGLIDELHLVISPVLLGTGEALLHDLDLVRLGYRCTAHTPTAAATHVVLSRSNT